MQAVSIETLRSQLDESCRQIEQRRRELLDRLFRPPVRGSAPVHPEASASPVSVESSKRAN